MQSDLDLQLAELLQYDPPREWRGGNLKLIQSRESEAIADGGAETGKTFAACYKSHMMCREYPGAQGALIRKVSASIPGTVLLTMKRIIGNFPVEFFGGERTPERIIYPNNSQIWLGGMDNPTKALSGERDFVQVCQAEELTQNDWEIIVTRVTGRGAVMPYTILFGDCNPAGSKHHLREREKAGHLKMYHTVLQDNPSLFDKNGNPTTQGKKTLARLDSLTGIRRKRLLEGLWATAEGAVYDTFDSEIHIKVRDPKEFQSWYLAIDEGYTNPAVILLVGEDGDGRTHTYKEFYERGKLQSLVVEQAKTWTLEYGVKLAAVDESAAGLIADLRNNGIPAVASKGRVLDGIQLMQNRLKVAGDGKPRETIDPSCVNTINEYESYVWKKANTTGIIKDEPQKENDHAMDARRYLEILINKYPISWENAQDLGKVEGFKSRWNDD